MINQEYKDTYSLVVINWFRKDWEYLISQYSRISASLYSCFPPPPPFEGILGFSVPSIILANLLEDICLLERPQKVIVFGDL